MPIDMKSPVHSYTTETLTMDVEMRAEIVAEAQASGRTWAQVWREGMRMYIDGLKAAREAGEKEKANA